MIDFCGRKIALMLTALPFSAGWLMIGFGKVPALLHAGRFFSGVGVGCASLIVPVSNKEVFLEMQGKKTAARGRMRLWSLRSADFFPPCKLDLLFRIESSSEVSKLLQGKLIEA